MLSATNAIRMPGATNALIPGLTRTELEPHQAAFSTISFSGLTNASGAQSGTPVGCGMNYLAGQPTGAVWRLTVSVQEKWAYAVSGTLFRKSRRGIWAFIIAFVFDMGEIG